MSVSEAKVAASVADRVRRTYGVDVDGGVSSRIEEILNTAEGNKAHAVADFLEANVAVKPNRRTAIHVASQIVNDTK